MRSWLYSRRLFVFAALLGAATLLQSCDPSDAGLDASTSCGTGSAAIGVTDGLIAPLCGCAGVADGWRRFDAGLTCNVPNGTTVVFYYLSTRNRHQIETTTTSTSSFSPSPVSDPAAKPMLKAHAVTLSTGNYTFSDAFDSNLNATINVL